MERIAAPMRGQLRTVGQPIFQFGGSVFQLERTWWVETELWCSGDTDRNAQTEMEIQENRG